MAAAVRDVTDFAEAGFVSYVDVEAASAQTGQTLQGRYDVLGSTAPDHLVVRPLTTHLPQPTNKPSPPSTFDPRNSSLAPPFTLGPHYSADFQVRRITAVRGERVVVRRLSLDLAGRTLSDLAAFVPTAADGAPVRHLFEGTVRLVEPAHVPPDPSHYATVEAAGPTLTLSFATLGDLARAGLDGHAVASGTVDVRLFLAPGAAERYDQAPARQRRTITVPFAPGDVPRLARPVGHRVARGDTLALLHAATVEEARADLDDALRVAAALDAQAPHEAAEGARYRMAAREARAALARVQQLAAEGFASPRAVVAAAEALREAFTARRVEATARVRRAHSALEALLRTSAVTAPAGGTVARVDTLRLSPTRHELRLHLEGEGDEGEGWSVPHDGPSGRPPSGSLPPAPSPRIPLHASFHTLPCPSPRSTRPASRLSPTPSSSGAARCSWSCAAACRPGATCCSWARRVWARRVWARRACSIPCAASRRGSRSYLPTRKPNGHGGRRQPSTG